MPAPRGPPSEGLRSQQLRCHHESRVQTRDLISSPAPLPEGSQSLQQRRDRPREAQCTPGVPGGAPTWVCSLRAPPLLTVQPRPGPAVHGAACGRWLTAAVPGPAVRLLTTGHRGCHGATPGKLQPAGGPELPAGPVRFFLRVFPQCAGGGGALCFLSLLSAGSNLFFIIFQSIWRCRRTYKS